MPNEKILPLNFPNIEGNIYASFWKRLGALFLDLLIFAPISIAHMYIGSLSRLNYFYTWAPMFILFIIYHVYFVKKWGGTPGKLLVGIKIIKIDGADVGWKNAFLRHAVTLILSLIGSTIYALALLKMTNAEFLSYDFLKTSEKIMEMSPVSYKYFNWVNDIWIWSEFIILLTNKRKRALHDYIAGTVVINSKSQTQIDNWKE